MFIKNNKNIGFGGEGGFVWAFFFWGGVSLLSLNINLIYVQTR